MDRHRCNLQVYLLLVLPFSLSYGWTLDTNILLASFHGMKKFKSQNELILTRRLRAQEDKGIGRLHDGLYKLVIRTDNYANSAGTFVSTPQFMFTS